MSKLHMKQLPDKYVFVDIETTGGRFNYDRIIEIGILRVENGTIVKTYETLINPGSYISPFIEEMTGITSAVLENAPSFLQVADEIFEILDGCCFVAHNARFDYGFLKHELKRAGFSFNAKQLCTVKLSRLLYPQHTHHNLDALIERFNFSCEKRHRAYSDAKVLWDFFSLLHKTIETDTLTSAFMSLLKQQSLPPNLSKDDLARLPEEPGVYIFYDENGVVLYIGKSTNIRTRVLSHFSSDYNSSTEMALSQQVRSIKSLPTAGELGALLLESSLIKSMQPIYNRVLRQTQKLIVVKEKINKEGYYIHDILQVDGIDITMMESIRGVFRSRKNAKEHLVKLAKEHNLCWKLIGVEKAKNECFAKRLEWCKGACTEEENPLSYNMRTTLAFSKLKIKKWLFDGPIGIVEVNPLSGMQEMHVIDKWCYLGSVKQIDGLDSHEYSTDYNFDLDTYKILERHLRNGKGVKVKKLTKEIISSLHSYI